MKPVPPQPRKFRKREIAFALAMGAVAAGGAAAIVSTFDDEPDYVAQEQAFSGPGAITYQLASFEKISTEGPQDVEIAYGEEISVRSEGAPAALAQLEAVVDDGRLVIRPKEGSFSGNWGLLEDAKFFVTMPRLEGIAMAGSGDIRIDRIEGDSFDATVGGSGRIDIGKLEVDEANFTVDGSGDVIVVGKARETQVRVAGSGEINAAGLHSTTASISIFGSGDVALSVEDEAQVSITGSGDVNISGPGRCAVTRMGGGNVRCSGGGGDEQED